MRARAPLVRPRTAVHKSENFTAKLAKSAKKGRIWDGKGTL